MPTHILPRIKRWDVHALTLISKAAAAVFEEGEADLVTTPRFAGLALGAARRAVMVLTARARLARCCLEYGLGTRPSLTQSAPTGTLTQQL